MHCHSWHYCKTLDLIFLLLNFVISKIILTVYFQFCTLLLVLLVLLIQYVHIFYVLSLTGHKIIISTFCHSQWSGGLVSIQLCLVLPPPSSSRCNYRVQHKKQPPPQENLISREQCNLQHLLLRDIAWDSENFIHIYNWKQKLQLSKLKSEIFSQLNTRYYCNWYSENVNTINYI